MMQQRTKDIIGKAVLETLEDRRLFSAITYADGVLGVIGDSGESNHLTIKRHEAGNHLTVSRNGIVTYHKIEQVDQLKIVGGSKSDVIYVAPTVDAGLSINSGAGADSIYAGKGDSDLGDADDHVQSASTGMELLEHVGLLSSQVLAVTSFTLIDSTTDKVIANFENLADGVTINLAALPSRTINIRANTSGGARAVHFSVSGRMGIERTDTGGPFALKGANRDNYWTWHDVRTGTYVMTATPFDNTAAQGGAGVAKTITFTIIDKPVSETDTDGGSSQLPPPSDTPTDGNTTPPPVDEPEAPPTDNTGEVGAPVPVITLVDSTIPAGHAMHFNALTSDLKSGDILSARFEWNFGDDGSKYNTLTGWTASHHYAKAGTYTVTLRVTNSAGKTATLTRQITVAPAERKVIYVSNEGSDSNSGLSPDQAIRTFEQAAWLVTDDTEIRFRRGDTFTTADPMILNHENVVITAYGTGDRPVIKLVDSDTLYPSVFTTSGGHNVTIANLTFDGSREDAHMISVGGRNISILNSQFLHAEYAINLNKVPTGVLIQDNVAPLADGINDYFVWSNGSDITVLGNTVANSFAHVLRLGLTNRMLLAHNDFSNPRENGIYRGTMTVQTGSYIYIANNTLNDGKLTIGPLGEDDGLQYKEKRMQWVVAENNRINSPLLVQHGAEHIMIRNNVINREVGVSIEVDGYNTTYGRGVVDLHILNNTGIVAGEYGSFIKVNGAVDGITMKNNLMYAPNLTTGSYYSAPVRVLGTDLSSFREISGNIWPMAETKESLGYGINWVGYEANATTYRTPTEWEGFGEVTGDKFIDVTLSLTWQVSLGGMEVGSSLARAA